ncbi:NTP pyrophosphohydrolase including oxidative damage repair enzymes [Anaerolinea thermolimosa]|nr:NTP pyrophosphohydrolase including oxidative damage repair enzymes [Anaerolinea thermolimosa]
MGMNDISYLDDINDQSIKTIFQTTDNSYSGINHSNLTPAAVLIPLYQDGREWFTLFTLRTDRVENHKGQVSFPGGAADIMDKTPVDTALRETFEETGIPPQKVQILGQMPPHISSSGFLIYPVIGKIAWPVALTPAENEVKRIFSVPLKWLAETVNKEERLYTRQNGTQEMVVFYKPYDGEIIWGITARIITDFLNLLQKNHGR